MHVHMENDMQICMEHGMHTYMCMHMHAHVHVHVHVHVTKQLFSATMPEPHCVGVKTQL